MGRTHRSVRFIAHRPLHHAIEDAAAAFGLAVVRDPGWDDVAELSSVFGGVPPVAERPEKITWMLRGELAGLPFVWAEHTVDASRGSDGPAFATSHLLAARIDARLEPFTLSRRAGFLPSRKLRPVGGCDPGVLRVAASDDVMRLHLDHLSVADGWLRAARARATGLDGEFVSMIAWFGVATRLLCERDLRG